jgi:single-strand DNA-binding protein
MANVNKVMLLGRLTRDPEARAFANGGRVVKFGFAVNNRKKNAQTGEWGEEPVFIDCEAFSGEYSKLADVIEKYLKKGSQAFLEGHLKLDQWDDKTSGQKRSQLRLVVDNVQLLDSRQDGSGQSRAPARSAAPAMSESRDDYSGGDSSASGGDSDIPF